MVEGEAKGPVLGLVPAGAQPQDQPPPADLVHGMGHLGQQGRVTEGIAGHQGAQLHPLRGSRQRRKHAPALPDAGGLAGLEAVEQVVVDPDRIETQLLGQARQALDLGEGHRPPQGLDFSQHNDNTDFDHKKYYTHEGDLISRRPQPAVRARPASLTPKPPHPWIYNDGPK